MQAAEILHELETLGTAQNRKVYRRHGVGENQFGVSYAQLYALQKRLKRNHTLAIALWDSGNHDARVLATLIADPKQADSALLAAWAQALDNYVLTDALARFVQQTGLALSQMRAWMESESEWLGQAGYTLLATQALHNTDLSDAFFLTELVTIERDIHTCPNRVRAAMNNALIAIGLRNEALQAEAIAAAERIGPVQVDHGETGCKTPEAAAYIRKAAAHPRKKRQAAR